MFIFVAMEMQKLYYMKLRDNVACLLRVTFPSPQFYSRNVQDPISAGAYNLKSISGLR